ncbi:hypothetical protein BJ742DRAFT_869059 [Cladochytrium replicatum]|nr:hypothetical protein BJ742DRAFT_869059 [Cladochytrium replicatum]
MLPLLSLILLSSQVKVHGQSIDASTSVAWHYLPGSAFCEDTCKAWKFTGVPFRTGNNINADYEQPMYLCYAPFSNAPWVGWNGSVKLINTTSGFCWSAYSISDTTYTSSPTCLCMDSSFPVGPVYLSESPRPTSALVCSDACPSKQITINDAKYRATFSPLTVNYRFACAANGGNQGVRGGWVDIMYNGTTESRCITSVGLPTLHANPDYACLKQRRANWDLVQEQWQE